jgi:23S rRNA (cytidine2498-2'-O)-methyltransferase
LNQETNVTPKTPPPDAIVTADADFVELARKEIESAAPDARVLAEPVLGVMILRLPDSYWALAEVWRRSPPIFVRHLCPVQEVMPLSAGPEAVQRLRAVAVERLADMIDPSAPFSVQSRILIEATQDAAYRPYDVNSALADALSGATGAPLDVRNPEQVVSVVVAVYDGVPTVFLGLSPVEYNFSAWAGGVRRFAREKGQISRAEFKLLEAVETFAVPLPERGLALDLGAAPGGWTRVLRQRGLRVIAVDPADLHPTLVADSGVRHMRMTAGAYLSRGPERFDLIVNDMRMDARDSARLMVAYADALDRDGHALMTLKLPEQRRRNAIDHALNILREAYEVVAARQLFHNRSEITVCLRPRSESSMGGEA